MSHLLEVSAVRFTAAGPRERDDGLLGFVSCVLGDALVLDGLMVRRTATTGALTLSFPSKHGKHPYLRPLNDRVRRDLEHQVFAAIRPSQGETP